MKESPEYSQSREVNVCVCVCMFALIVCLPSCIHVYNYYVNKSWQWVITDARHDSTANTYGTTVPFLSGR